MATAAPQLAADLEAGLRRLRLGAMRRLAAELLVSAKTQRWQPEELLRTLVEAEIASRDASNARARLKQAAFPVTKDLEEFDVACSSIKPATFDYLASLEWIAAKENLCLVGPAGTGKSHLLVALGQQAVEAGMPRPLLHRPGADRDAPQGSGGQFGRPGDRADPESRPHPDRRDRLRADGRHRRHSCSSGSSPPLTRSVRSRSRHTGRSRSGGASCPSTPRPSACSTGYFTTASSSSPKASRSA